MNSLLITGMRGSIDLDHEPFFETDEVGDISAHRHLSSEFEIAASSISQGAPDDGFRIDGRLSKSSCQVGHHAAWDLAGHAGSMANVKR